LRITGTRTVDGVSIWELAGTGGEGPYEVRDQQLSEEEIRALQQALDEYLTGTDTDSAGTGRSDAADLQDEA
jgi:hypothetical protein